MIKFLKKNKQVEQENIELKIIQEQGNFQYKNEVFELNRQVEKQLSGLLLEEGKTTHGLSDLLEGAGYTTEQIEQVEGYLNSLSQNSENTRNLVNNVFESLNLSSGEISKAKDQTNKLISQMNVVLEVFEQFISLFAELQSHYNSIENFANVIQGIASQTNLLSLNASIEAARAGEQGRSFAVVANEIKKLSNDTQNNTKDIIESLNKMTSIIDLLNVKSNEGQKEVTSTMKLIKYSESSLDNIINSENEVNVHVKEVEASQENNLLKIQDVTKNLSNIVNKSKSENQQLEELIESVQTKSDFYLYILNHINQIKLLEAEN
ncbi:MAG: chemotaxis protein [Clostridiaceae bacterium]|jgi:methyl-accepting chemotaxis protein|nr:chemotaxis protein [Clostridiaceae bacterium]